jgi:hypothetical protein
MSKSHPLRQLEDRPELPSWEAHIHPEGQLYFVQRGPLVVIVTEAYLYNAETMERITRFVQLVESVFVSMEFKPSKTVELLLQLKDGEDYYYFVDHETRTQFWTEGTFHGRPEHVPGGIDVSSTYVLQSRP